jgi:P-type E1-E2 ATPase
VSLEEAHLTKPESKMVVSMLKELGMKISMITGDNKHTALKVANYLGIK